MSDVNFNDRLKKISKKILCEYLWVSKEKYPQKPSWGGPWNDTEKGWSSGTDKKSLDYSNVEISCAISNILQTKKYDNLIEYLNDPNNLSNKFNYILDEYSSLYEDFFNFNFENNNEKELKKIVKNLKKCSKYFNFIINYDFIKTMEVFSIEKHIMSGKVNCVKPNKLSTVNDLQIYKDIKDKIEFIFENFCKMFSEKYSVNTWGDLEVYSSDKITRSECLEGMPNINISSFKVDYYESYSESNGTPLNREKIKKKWDFNIGVFVHEIAHHMEHVNSHINKRCNEFFEYRTRGESYRKLNDLWIQRADEHSLKNYPKGPYEFDEIAKADKFFNPYCGKFYPSGATEIFSMGVQRLIEEPISFFNEDKEYFYFILALMRGEL